MSHPNPTAADLIEEAGLPCHHRREPFGPCETCLDDVVHRATDGLFLIHEQDLAGVNEQHAEELRDRDNDQMAVENERDAAVNALHDLVTRVREVSAKVTNSSKEYIEQELDAAAESAETAT